MWILHETENQLTIKAFPLLMWSFVVVCFIFGIFVLQVYINVFADASNLSRLFEQGILEVIITIGIISFLPVTGLVLFHFSPFIITKIDRQKQTLTHTSFTLLGKRTREFGFSHLKGGIRVNSEEDEDGKTFHSLYFETESDEKISLSKELSYWERRTFDVAVKANEFLRPKV